jgi:hypothetical protein
MRKYLIIIQLVAIAGISPVNLKAQNVNIQPGNIWNDTQGNPINAHGGGVLYHNGIYYWFGEIKKGKTWRVPYINSWECYRTDAGGVSCYSSKDLLNWKYEGVALTPNVSDSSNDLHISKVIERPKVVYNEKTKKFVMWLHIDSEDYSYARAGVAVSDNPTGPYTFLYSMRPNNQMSRDMTLFKDTDGKAYHIFSSENNAVMHISLLTDDYLKPSGIETRIFVNESREAPSMFKYKGKYYLITSGCTGWAPNEAMIASADTILGRWSTLYNSCSGPDSKTTFGAQSTNVTKVEGRENAFIFMADRWNKTNLEDSRYVWLPINISDNEIIISWTESWNLNYFKK